MIHHLGIIMDGNRRWAKNRFFPALVGHKSGANNAVKITRLALNKGIKYITLWALSTDNLNKRDSEEVEGIIKLINNIESYLGEMIKDGLRFDTIGDLSKLPKKSQNILAKVKNNTKNNTGITLVLALVYGGQDEIIRATKKIITSGINPDDLTNQEFRKYTDTGKFPIVDIIVRTGGDKRHSGFMLYDSEYVEYHFVDKMWPDYNEDELDKTIEIYNKAHRKFGK